MATKKTLALRRMKAEAKRLRVSVRRVKRMARR